MKNELYLLILLCTAVLVPAAYAAGGIAVTEGVDLWTGSWLTEKNATVDLTQTGTNVTGIYIPEEGVRLISSTLEGTVSDDGKEVVGTWKDIGPITMNLSDDMGSAEILWGCCNELETYTRDGSDGVTGEWKSADYLLTLTGEGTSLTGKIVTTDPNLTEFAEVTGTVSDDGKSFEGTWIETGKFRFTMEEGNDAYTGMLGYGDLELAESWDGTRIQ